MEFMNVNEVKSIVKQEIEKQKDKVTLELNTIADKIDNHNLLSKVIGELVEIYGNNNKQREVMIEVLRTIPSNYFKFSETKGQMNKLNLMFNGVTLSISTSRSKNIEVELYKLSQPVKPKDEVYRTYSPYEVDFIEEWDERELHKLDGDAEKALIKSYFNAKGVSVPFFKRNLRKNNYEEISVYIEDIKKRINIYKRENHDKEKKYDEYVESLDKYNQAHIELNEHFEEFIDENLFVLKDFKDGGWKVKFTNVPEELIPEM